MPDARLEPDGTFRFGVSQADPYFSVWSSITALPRLELSGRYVTIDGVPGFVGAPELGDYRDKAFDAKLLLLEESAFLPAVAIGVQDYLGTRLFQAKYVAVSKRFAEFDVTAGYGDGRIPNAFGGVRYRPAALRGWSFAVEYDANDYRRDHRADLSGAEDREGGWTYAIGYRGAWWGTQLSYQDGTAAGNVYLAIPLMERELVPKIGEPAPYDAATAQVSSAPWRADSRHAVALVRALERQGYTDVRLRLDGDVLDLALTHDRISLISRAVGRAARTALALGPSDLSTLRITYTVNEQPLLTYEFRELHLLARYFTGIVSRPELQPHVAVTYASSDLARRLSYDARLPLDGGDDADTAPIDTAAYLAAVRAPGSGFGVLPFSLRVFFNDPGQPIRYDTFSVLRYKRRADRGLFVNGSARFTLFENVSDVSQPSTSLLPHVRSDIGEYRREGDRLRLNTLLLNKYTLLHERWYGRVSAGYYEEMFAGGGGQLLYLPAGRDWAVDLAVDALRQRAPGEAFGFRDYSVVTALASLHYRFPDYGFTATARIGRFLAKDEGVRFELKRRFRSGVEVGGWYSWTNEKDVTSPGSLDSPYRDRGIFISVPLSPLLTKDTQEYASLSLADYSRDVGQIVASPGDLYGMMERRLRLSDPEYDFLSAMER